MTNPLYEGPSTRDAELQKLVQANDTGYRSSRLAQVQIPDEDFTPDFLLGVDDEPTVSCLTLAVHLQALCTKETTLYNAYERSAKDKGSQHLVTEVLHKAWQEAQNNRVAIEEVLNSVRVPIPPSVDTNDLPTNIFFDVNS